MLSPLTFFLTFFLLCSIFLFVFPLQSLSSLAFFSSFLCLSLFFLFMLTSFSYLSFLFFVVVCVLRKTDFDYK